ncbi:MAG: hypothetical protein Hals2KO_19590 [Halioglobus sp.]
MNAHILISIFLALATASATAADCAINPDRLGAIYVTGILDAAGNSSKPRQLELWRDGPRVLRVNPENNVAELWANAANKLYLTRYFDGHERGIEYHPGDIDSDLDKAHWQQIRQILPDSKLGSMQLIGESGSGCDKVQIYEANLEGTKLRVKWLPATNLVKEIQRSDDSQTTLWSLREVIGDGAEIAAAFAGRDDYQLIDYADIGDNESDPFLHEMAHIGFTGQSRHGAPGGHSH